MAKSGDHAKAIDQYQKVLIVDPKYVPAYMRRAHSLVQLKIPDQALNDYNQAIKLDPKFAKAYNERGFVYAQKGEYKSARGDWEKTVELDRTGPSGEKARKNLGILRDMGY